MRLTIAVGALAALALWSTPSFAEEPQPEAPVVPGGIHEHPPSATQTPPVQAPPQRPVGILERLRPNLFGYVKLGYFHVLNTSEDQLIGSNSGFRLINARVGLSLEPVDRLKAVISLEAAAPTRRELDPLEGTRVVSLKDGYIELAASPLFHVRGGQFKAPFNGEVLLPDEALPFITRSIVSDGLLPPEGPRVNGLSLDRQVGIQLSSDRIGGDLGAQYAVALVNGNGPNVLNNDNNAVAPVARVAILYKDLLSLAVNGYFNPATVGERPARIKENQLAYGGDLSVNVAGLNAFAMVLVRTTTHESTGLPAEQALGAVMSAKYYYEPLGIEAGTRFAWYEPSDAQPDDIRNELTAMVGYRLREFPARILVQYTMRGEEAGAEIANDSVDALAQVTF